MVPAAEEAEPLWMNKFGFRKLAPEEVKPPQWIWLICELCSFWNLFWENLFFFFCLINFLRVSHNNDLLLQLSKYVKVSYQMVRFKGASMLQKPVRSYQITDEKTEAEDNFDLKQPKESLKMDEWVDEWVFTNNRDLCIFCRLETITLFVYFLDSDFTFSSYRKEIF